MSARASVCSRHVESEELVWFQIFEVQQLLARRQSHVPKQVQRTHVVEKQDLLMIIHTVMAIVHQYNCAKPQPHACFSMCTLSMSSH